MSVFVILCKYLLVFKKLRENEALLERLMRNADVDYVSLVRFV